MQPSNRGSYQRGPARYCNSCKQSYRGEDNGFCQACAHKLIMDRMRSAAKAEGHRMEKIQDDVIQGAYVCACLTCGRVVALDPEEDPVGYGTANTQPCIPIFGPADRRTWDEFPVLTDINREPMPRALPHMTGTTKNGVRKHAPSGDGLMPPLGAVMELVAITRKERLL